MSWQLEPAASHCFQRYEYWGVDPLQVPLLASSDSLSFAVPVSIGRLVLTGGTATTAGGAELVAPVLPALLVAVTTRRRRLPTSIELMTYVSPVAPAIETQLLPLPSQ